MRFCIGPRRATFDVDNIDIGPERRGYLEQKLERVWEQNSEVRGDGGLPARSLARLHTHLYAAAWHLCPAVHDEPAWLGATRRHLCGRTAAF